MSREFDMFRSAGRKRVDQAMVHYLDAAPFPCPDLGEAIRYVLLAGGKRLRPLLVYGGCQALGGVPEDADAAACAVEFIHAYSLIHDDLPALDDDDLRRGRPSLHRAFDEATAILAGDAMQSMAFDILSAPGRRKGDSSAMVRELARAAGPHGMVAGQMRDLAADGAGTSLAELETTHRLKTAALIEASVLLGAMSAGGASATQLAQLREYGRRLGLAFQIQDDILDVIADTETLGKPQGSDSERGLPTYVSLLGLDSARERASRLVAGASGALAGFGVEEAAPLRRLAEYVVERID